MSLPTNVGSGRIVGRYVVGVIDSPDDTDDEPELIPARGTITFTPSIGYVPNSTTEIPMTIMKAPITGVLDSEGYLCTPDNTNTSSGGLTRGVKLFATDVGQVTGWTYSVKYSFTPVGTVSPHIPDHPLSVPDKSTRDLATVAPTPYTPIKGIPQIEATALRAEKAATDSALSSQESAQSSQQALTSVQASQASAQIAQASAESMVIANDESMSLVASDPESEFSTHLSVAIDGKVTPALGAKVDRAPLRQYGLQVTSVDRGHLFLRFDPTGAMIASMTRSVGGRTIGRSTDDGKTWSVLGTPNSANTTTGLWFTTAGTWIAYSAGSLYRSIDSGVTWVHVATTGTILNKGLTQRSSDGSLWAAEYLGSARVWKSVNDGLTWTMVYDFPNTDDGSGTVIRHIHGIADLPSGLWCFTGDNNTHCGLWRWEGETFVRKSPFVDDLNGAQRWRAVDVAERNGWLYWAQDGASGAGDIPAIVKAHPSDLAGTLTILAEIPTGGWYTQHLPGGEIIIGCVNEGIGKESDRTARVWLVDNNDVVSEIWSAPAATNLAVEFIAARYMDVRQSDGVVGFVINQTELTGSGTSAQATILGRVSPGVPSLAMTRATTPRAYPDTARAWNTPAPATQGVSTGAGIASYQVIPEMELDINSETTRPIVVTLNLDCRINTANQYAYVRLIATDKVTGGVVTIGRPIRYGSTTYGPVAITGLFTPAGAGDYILRAEWFATGSAIADSGSGYRQITAWQV